MCVLTMKKIARIRYGYKIVAIDKKTGKRYSIAMGFCYDDHERIPEVKIQNEISGYFFNGILNDRDGAYSTNMVGRTALFENFSDALKMFHEINRYFDPDSYPDQATESYRLAIMSCYVKEDIMSGHYSGIRVIAGKKLTFLKEVTTD